MYCLQAVYNAPFSPEILQAVQAGAVKGLRQGYRVAEAGRGFSVLHRVFGQLLTRPITVSLGNSQW